MLHTAFYKFVAVTDVGAVVAAVRAMAAELTGGIIVAEEGISGVAAGQPDASGTTVTRSGRSANSSTGRPRASLSTWI